jgi:hypothetical protein
VRAARDEASRCRRLGNFGVVLLALLAGCGSSGETRRTYPEVDQDPRSEASSPFTVGAVPPGYEIETAGMGTAVGEWSSDSFGTVEPYTALSPDGRPDHPEVVLVAITGFEGYQGGLAQASVGYLSQDREELTVDGAEAMYAPATDDARGLRWADLVVVRSDDLAVRVSSPSASRAELIDIVRRVEVPDDRTLAPTVPDPPNGLQLVGSADVDGVLATDVYVAPNTDQIPGPRSAHAAGWTRAGSGGGDQLAVLTLPGSALDLEAVGVGPFHPPWMQESSHARVVEGRPALVAESHRTDLPGADRRSVFVESAWGDVVLVSATGAHLPTEDDLVALAASVQQSDQVSWDAFVIDATGGPGLHADRGRAELARGTIGDLEWLLQDGPPGGGIVSSSATDPDSRRGVDPCLKLSNRTRACAGSGFSGTEDDWYASAERAAPDSKGLSFVVISTTFEAATVRITTSTSTGSAALVPVLAGGMWAVVVFVDDAGGPNCDAAPPAPHQMRIELLDQHGAVAGCLSQGGVIPPTSG